MAKIIRKTATIFGSAAGTDQIAQFGSLAAASPSFSTDPAVIQALANWQDGWFAGVETGNSPAIEDMNAYCYVTSYQEAYALQAGIPEWDSGTTYYIGSFVRGVGTGILYVSLLDTNLNNAVTNGTYWQSYAPAAAGSVAASSLTGTTLASNVVTSSLTALGTLTNLTVTNPIVGSVTGNAATASAVAASAITGTTLASNVISSSLTSVGTLAALTVTATITGSVSGNAATASAVAAANLTGSTLAAGVTASSLTSLGTIASLVATNATFTPAVSALFNGSSTGTAFTNAVTPMTISNTNATTNNWGALAFSDNASNLDALIACQFVDRTNHYGLISMGVRSAAGFLSQFQVSGTGLTLGNSSSSLMTLNCTDVAAASGVGTFTNLPTGKSGNPTGYIQMTHNGSTIDIAYW